MKVLSAWLARRRRRRANQKLMRQLIAGMKRAVAFENQVWEAFEEFCNTDFAALWADYAIALGKTGESLTTEEKKQAHFNYVLRDREE